MYSLFISALIIVKKHDEDVDMIQVFGNTQSMLNRKQHELSSYYLHVNVHRLQFTDRRMLYCLRMGYSTCVGLQYSARW